jgi:serine/threonine-protein kinase
MRYTPQVDRGPPEVLIVENSTLSAGTLVLGKLRVVRTLGVGGMGIVYEVEHELTKHRRALKVLNAYAAEQPSVIERFLREASAAGRVGNAHVAETFDAGKLESGAPYLLMELLNGQTLESKLQSGGPLDPAELADLVHQACDGVQAAHDAGIVHRDLKPENLMIVTKEGAPFVKIFDFGISKFDADRTGSMKLTQEGLVMGTPYYMSPEQVRGALSIDARTDVYALGVILYECACGIRPFDADAIQHLAVLIHEGKATPLGERRPSLPAAFCAVVHRAMAVDRNVRFATAREMAAALAPFFKEPRAVTVASASAPFGVAPTGNVSHSHEAGSSDRSSTASALAHSVGSSPPARTRRTGRALALAALVMAAVGTLVFSVTRPPHRGDASSPAAAGASVAGGAITTVARSSLVPPLPPAVTAEVAEAPTASSGPKLDALRKAAPPPHVALAASAQATPAAAPSARPRDDNGLARDNPFR